MSPELQSPQPASKGKVFLQRTFSTVVLLAWLGGVVWWDYPLGYDIFVWLCCALTAWEWGTMLNKSGKPGIVWLVRLSGIVYPALLIWFCFDTESMCLDSFSMAFEALLYALAAPIGVAIWSFIWEMRRPIEGSRALQSVGTTVVAFIYPGWMFAFTILLIHILPGDMGIRWAIFLVLVTKMTDIFAYLSGCLCGGKWIKRKLIPHISPKKTWEGIIGSFIITSVVAYFMLGWLDLTHSLEMAGSPLWVIFPAMMVILFFLAVTGDLAGSLVKRSLEIKDSGSLLPGIGGVLDLIDSPAFTVSAFLVLIPCVMAVVDMCARFIFE